MMLINDYVNRHTELSETMIVIIREFKLLSVFGLVFLYTYMLKMRSKYYAKNGGFLNSLLVKPLIRAIMKRAVEEKKDI